MAGDTAPPRSPRIGRPSAVRSARLESDILDLAWALFTNHGLAGVTVDAIAARGHLSKRTIYARFESKEALFAAALRRQVGLWSAEVLTPVSDADFPGWAQAFAGRILRSMMTREGAALAALVSGEGQRFPDILRIHEDAVIQIVTTLATVLNREIARGTVTLDDPEIAARCWLDMLIGHTRSSYHLHPGDFDVEAHLRQWSGPLTRMFLRMVRYREA